MSQEHDEIMGAVQGQQVFNHTDSPHEMTIEDLGKMKAVVHYPYLTMMNRFGPVAKFDRDAAADQVQHKYLQYIYPERKQQTSDNHEGFEVSDGKRTLYVLFSDFTVYVSSGVHTTSQGIRAPDLEANAKHLAAKLIEIVTQMNQIDPVATNPDDHPYGNDRAVVQLAKTIAQQVLKAADVDGYGGCLLCGG